MNISTTRDRKNHDDMRQEKITMDSEHVEEVLRHFVRTDNIINAAMLKGGAINGTYLVKTDKGDYILQSLNDFVFGGNLDGIERNYRKFAEARSAAKSAEGVALAVPEWIMDDDGRYLWRDSDGLVWRVYPYIKGEPLKLDNDSHGDFDFDRDGRPAAGQDTDSEGQNFDTIAVFAQAVADMHRILKHYPGQPEKVIPDYHRIDLYYDNYLDALDVCGCGDDDSDKLNEENSRTRCSDRRDDYCESIITANIDYILKNCVCEADSVVHGDTKIENVLYDRESGTASFIDLDTFTAGSQLMDVADSVRSILCGGEDLIDEDGADAEEASFNIHFAQAKQFVAEYYKAAGRVPSDDEKRDLRDLIVRMPFELGLRFYTDHLRGNVYFPVESDGENLLRAKQQFTLFRRSDIIDL